MLGGYSAVAAELTYRFGLDPPLDRRQVYAWNTRRTLNRDGRMFPSPVSEDPGGTTRRPRLLFDVGLVAAWFAAGTPGTAGSGWRSHTRSDSVDNDGAGSPR